ncbi:MAG: hypothetical protein KJ914_04170 [Gammaproteobacteria bacterium]|nr:hypothetical protein [Gammaproteobacteria bacterium]MBU1723005.1 hypothetical protein [Gammaproteobacteria bacterium]MBU2003806.1 hypothetical protein [Gammaproteobacteria bacterium]
MHANGPQRYRIQTAAQWRAGVADRLTIGADGLHSASSLMVEEIPGTSRADNTPALDTDACGSLYWVRAGTFEFMRAMPEGVQMLGHLRTSPDDPADWLPVRLSMGVYRLWLLTRAADPAANRTRLWRYYTDTLQRMVSIDTERPALDMAGDGRDGVWLLLGGDNVAAELLHLDRTGETLQRLRLEGMLLQRASLAFDACAGMLFILDADPQTDPCKEPLAWRLLQFDPCSANPQKNQPATLFSLPRRDGACNRNVPPFHPDRFVLDPDGRIHLLASVTGDWWSLSRQGEVLAQLPDVIPQYQLPIGGLVMNAYPVIASNAGLGELHATGKSRTASGDTAPSYIAPLMISPDDVQGGWLRADLDAVFGPGSAIEISVASTREQNLIEEVSGLFANTALPATARFQRINARLPWTAERSVVYQGLDWPAGQPLGFPLQEVTDTHLWLRIRVLSVDGAKPPQLKSLQVFYPNISYARYLPAVYQETPQAAKTLRRLLSVFESLFGDLDRQLGELPSRIHPDTAPNEWLSWLLGWLGLPTPVELAPAAQRALLKAAPKLLQERGSKAALEQLLQVLLQQPQVAGGSFDFQVDDNSEGPVPWVLPAAGDTCGPRLGSSTLVLAQRQPGFRLGCDALLDEQPLGYCALDPLPMFARTSGLIVIRVALPPGWQDARDKLEPLLQRYLPHFIPAHCRYELRFVAPDALPRHPILDETLVLHDAPPPRLGEGCLRLASGKGSGVVVGRSALTRDGPRLT